MPLVVLVSFTMVAASGACGGGGDDGREPPRLVQPNAERLARLAAAQPDAGTAVGGGASDAGPKRSGSDDYPRGAADFTSAAQFEAYIAECEAYEPKTDAVKTKDTVYRGTKPFAVQAPPSDNVFRWMEVNPEYLDPNRIAESAGTNIALNLFETLVVTAPGNSPPAPGAAQSWEVSPDGLVWTFHIRPGMTWSDGHAVTAHDFEYSWKRGLSPELASKNAEQLWFLKGARAYSDGTTKTADGVGVKAVDDLTLVATLEGPAPFFLDLVTYIAYAPVPRWAIEQWGDRWTDVDHMVTNGPFKLKSWVDRDRIELEKSATYWDAANVKLAGSTIYFTENESKNTTLYAAGQSHVARPLAPAEAKRFIHDGRDDMTVAADGCIYFYVLRTDRPPFDDARVRKAFNLALDKERLVASVLGLFQKVATSVTPELVGGFTGYVPPKGPDYNPTMARELLAAAGFPNGVGLELDISYNTFEGHKLIAEFAGQNWAETLGVRITTSNMEWKSLLKKQLSGDFQMSRAGWCPDYPDALTFLGSFDSQAENNYPAYKNPAYDAVLARVRAEGDRHKRNVLMCAAEKGLVRDMPVVPMYQYTRSYLLRTDVNGYLPQYQDRHLLKWISLPGHGG